MVQMTIVIVIIITIIRIMLNVMVKCPVFQIECFNSSKTEIRFPVNLGITGHVATTGEVMMQMIMTINNLCE